MWCADGNLVPIRDWAKRKVKSEIHEARKGRYAIVSLNVSPKLIRLTDEGGQLPARRASQDRDCASCNVETALLGRRSRADGSPSSNTQTLDGPPSHYLPSVIFSACSPWQVFRELVVGTTSERNR
jgi:hypothetical protein